MKEQTLKHILDVGMQLMLEKGYNKLGINEVLDTAEIPKGSFYYYFKSKEDFGLKVIQYYSANTLQFVKQHLEDKSKDPRARLIDFFEGMKPIYQEKAYKEGCLLGNCSLELSDQAESFRNLVSNELNQWQSAIEACITEGQKSGSIKSGETAKDLANFILNSWEGALLRMKASKNPESYNNFVYFLDKYMI
ncbi:TetR/AcrR family transcriptional regulator [Flagellimonas allohymeniacidonis]|nr:TetR/AcrR family transcriptional regulator [Allomuricauda hymeniacidonis]